jgi:polar amino acid transport system substrate-binding protein
MSVRFVAFIAASLLSGAAFAQQPLVTGVDGTFAPHAMPKIGGGVEGFNVDLAEEIGKRLGRPVQILAQEFSGLIPGLNSKRFDFIAAPTTVTPERTKTLLFTEGYLNTDYIFVQKKEAPDIKTLEDLKGKTIAVNKGSAYDSWAQQNAQKYGFESQAYPTNADAVQAVMTGRAFANLAGNTVAAWSAKQNPQLKTTYRIDTGLVWAVPLRRDDNEMRNRIDEAIECMKQDGTIARMHEKWFGTKPEAGSAAVTVFPGYGVPGMEGHDPTPHTAKCS